MDYNKLCFDMTDIEEERNNYNLSDMSLNTSPPPNNTTNTEAAQSEKMKAVLDQPLIGNKENLLELTPRSITCPSKMPKLGQWFVQDPNLEQTLWEDEQKSKIWEEALLPPQQIKAAVEKPAEQECPDSEMIDSEDEAEKDQPSIGNKDSPPGSNADGEYQEKEKSQLEKSADGAQESGSGLVNLPENEGNECFDDEEDGNDEQKSRAMEELSQLIFEHSNLEELVVNTTVTIGHEQVDSNVASDGAKIDGNTTTNNALNYTIEQLSHRIEDLEGRFRQFEHSYKQILEEKQQILVQLENNQNEVNLLRGKVTDYETELDSFEQLEGKLINENFELKREMLQLKSQMSLISVDDACRELGCTLADFQKK